MEDHALIWDEVNFGLDYGGLWDTVFINAIFQRSFLRRKSDNSFSTLFFLNVISQTFFFFLIYLDGSTYICHQFSSFLFIRLIQNWNNRKRIKAVIWTVSSSNWLKSTGGTKLTGYWKAVLPNHLLFAPSDDIAFSMKSVGLGDAPGSDS